jgi:hypothetical protein
MASASTHLTLSAAPARQRAAHWTDETGTGFKNPWVSAVQHPVSHESAECGREARALSVANTASLGMGDRNAGGGGGGPQNVLWDAHADKKPFSVIAKVCLLSPGSDPTRRAMY